MKQLGFNKFTFCILEKLKMVTKKEVIKRIKFWKLKAKLAQIEKKKID